MEMVPRGGVSVFKEFKGLEEGAARNSLQGFALCSKRLGRTCSLSADYWLSEGCALHQARTSAVAATLPYSGL
jgi:hypothetical protein